MTLSRRNILMGAAALSAAVVTPETVRAMAAMQATADWALATADLEADVAPRSLRLVHGRAPADLAGTLFRNGPGKFRRPGGSVTHWFDGDGEMDLNPFGIPTEPYAFSNNAIGNMGPARWGQARFTVTGATAQTIRLR